MTDPRVEARRTIRVSGGKRETFEDSVAVERALDMRVNGRPLAVTLRTPGNDEELVLGVLAGEAIVRVGSEVATVELRAASCADEPDVAEITLAPGVAFDWTRFERHFAATAACGLCGRAHLESLRAGLAPLPDSAALDPATLVGLPARLRGRQRTFEATGGLHAAAWCDERLEPRALREDV